MNIDNLLDLGAGIYAYSEGGEKIPGKVAEISDNDSFVFVPDGELLTREGTMVKISDGQDSVLVRVLAQTGEGIRMCIECYTSPGNERRQDVRIYDKIYIGAKFLCSAEMKPRTLAGAVERIRANKLLIDSFLKGKYGYPGIDEMPYTKESPHSQALWEINRKLDLLIHMSLAEDFKALMATTPREVNISASGIRFISDSQYKLGDLLEINLILPMVPLLFLRFVGDVIRVKAVTSYEMERHAVAVRFLQVDPETKDDVIRYLFRRQREQLRKR